MFADETTPPAYPGAYPNFSRPNLLAALAEATPPSFALHLAVASGTIDSPRANQRAWEVELASKLCSAAAHSDLERLPELLDAGACINLTDYDRRSALHVAAAEGHLEVVQLLITRRADVCIRDRWGQTPLDEATRCGHIEVKGALVAAGAEEASMHLEQAAKLCSAAAAGRIAQLRDLLEARASPSVADYDGRTALHLAAAHHQPEAVQLLVQWKAHVNARDHFGLTALCEAIRGDSPEIVNLLREAGAESADIDQLRMASASEQWAIPAKEVQLGECLSTTLKSSVYTATWRGTKVVVKMVKPVNLHRVSTISTSTAGKQEEQQESVTSQQAHALEEMLHEIRTLSTLRHPDLVLFLGACFDAAPCFFLTEYMEGGDLERYYAFQSQKLGHLFRPPIDTVVRWAGAVARALGFLHSCSRPIIHRDLKPLNLLLTRNLDLKVTDFGLSKIITMRTRGAASNGLIPAPFMSGGVGTWRYMAPEVVRYEQYTDRIDIYSFGLILYFMCSGQQPFYEICGTNPELVLKAYLRGEEPRPHLTSTIGTAPLRELMKDAWHVVPAKRPSGCECAARLESMRSGTSATCGLQ